MRPDAVLLAVDLSYQTYRSCSVHRHLKNADKQYTGGLYGFMVTLANAIIETGATRVVVCEDRKPYVRSRTYPAYKQIRKKSQDEELRELFLESEVYVREFCAEVGIPLYGVDGFESDDCIGHIVRSHRGRFKQVYAASNDSDLYQLFTCPWFRVWRKQGDLMDGTMLGDLFDRPLTPDQWMLASALMGTHNDIEGIKGVGPMTALAAVREPGTLRSYREKHGELIDRNLGLIKLPHPEFPDNLPLPARTRPFSARGLYRWCARWDIHVTQSMTEAFKQVDT